MSGSTLHDDFRDLLYVAAALLEDDEYWVAVHPSGQPLPASASKTVSIPIVLACMAFDADWSAVKEMGYAIGRGRFAHDDTADGIMRRGSKDTAQLVAGMRRAP